MVGGGGIGKEVRGTHGEGMRVMYGSGRSRREINGGGVGERDVVTPWHVRETAVDGVGRGGTS